MSEPEQQDSMAALHTVWIELAGNLCRLLVILALVPVVAGGYVFLSQVVLWLKFGLWVSLPLSYLFTDFWPVVAARFTPEQMDRITAPGGVFADPLALIGEFSLKAHFPGFAAWLAEPRAAGGIGKIIAWVFETVPIALALAALTVLLVFILLRCAALARRRVAASRVPGSARD